MITGIQAALSGLQAFATKIENTANNIANMNTEGFKKDRVVLSAQAPQGVKATIEQLDTPGAVIAESTDQGVQMIEQSNVDLSEEMPEMLLDEYGYTANLKTLQTADQMMQSLLDIKA
jgi:flagellar basal-body rod protein FlgC